MSERLNTPFWQSLRTRIVLLVLAGALPALIALGMEHYRGHQNRIAAQINSVHLQLETSLTHVEGISQAAQAVLLGMVNDLAVHHGDIAHCQVYLQGLQPRFPQFAIMAFADMQGRVACASTPESIGVDIADRAYFKTVVNERRLVVSGLLTGRRKDAPQVIIMAQPVESEAGELLGVVFVALKIETT